MREQMNTVATCPACGIMCDDVLVDSQSGKTTSCNKAISFFKNAFGKNNLLPSINGNSSSFDEAIQHAATLLKKSQQPHFGGLGTEVKGMRAVIDLAKKANATLDHMHAEGTVNNTLTLQNIGYQTTTLTEVKNRADVILIIGTELSESHPRFFDKVVWNASSMFDKPTPTVMHLGLPKDTPSSNLNTSTSPEGNQSDVIYADKSDLPAMMNTLNALLNSKNPIHKDADETTIASTNLAALKNIVTTMQKAQYGVVVWSASSLKVVPHAELVTQSIVHFINKLNETNRVAGLPLNSGDGDTTVNNTSTWVTGYPTRNRFIDGVPSYDARTLSSKQQLKQTDSLLWVSCFNDVPPPATKAPTIVIGHPNTAFKNKAPDVFIPVAVPGVHATGTMFRMDSSVTLPLQKITDSDLPTLATVLEKIEGLLV